MQLRLLVLAAEVLEPRGCYLEGEGGAEGEEEKEGEGGAGGEDRSKNGARGKGVKVRVRR